MDLTGIGSIFDLGKSVIERIWPDETKRAEELRKLEELKQKGDLAHLNAHVQLLVGQMETNKEQAKHKSIFVAGARPAIMWIGAIGLGYAAILEPIIRMVASLCGYTGDFPVIDTTITMQVLFGLLGLGAYRTVEKSKGVQTDRIDRLLNK